MTGPLLQVERLSVELAMPSGERLRAVDEVSFELAEGEVMGLVGESGCGKSMTCRAVMRLLPGRAGIVSGRVLLAGTDLTALGESQMRQVRGRGIGMIFQNPASHLDPVMAIGDQIGESLRVHQGLSRREALGQAVALLRQVGIPDPALRAGSYPHELSGGMRQRAMIAAALAGGPKVLIADEPTTALDVTVQAQILRLLLDLSDTTGLAIILVTHDLAVVAETCQSIAVMYAGRVVERAAKRELLQRPLHPYTLGLIGSRPGAGQPQQPLPSIPGMPPSLGDLPPGCRFHPRCDYAAAACRTVPPPLVEVAPGRMSACLRWAATGTPA